VASQPKSRKGNRAKFNPLALRTLAETMVGELRKQPVVPLDSLEPFEGPGVYALYYTGPFKAYQPVASANRNGKWDWPIYVGKAKFERLRNHAESIKEVKNLSIHDFWCHFLVTEEVFIPLCESLLIEKYRPIWNNVVKGFGPKVVGKERKTQQISMWDILHPGRHGRGAAPNKKYRSPNDVMKKLDEFYGKVVPTLQTSARKG
jgi:Eco29kI restriction endonuclease